MAERPEVTSPICVGRRTGGIAERIADEGRVPIGDASVLPIRASDAKPVQHGRQDLGAGRAATLLNPSELHRATIAHVDRGAWPRRACDLLGGRERWASPAGTGSDWPVRPASDVVGGRRFGAEANAGPDE